MQVKTGCELIYNSSADVPLILLVRPRDRANHILLKETRQTTPQVPIHDFTDLYGNNFWRMTAPAGKFRIYYDSLSEVPPTPDPVLSNLPGHLVQDLPDDALHFLLPSRHCQSDILISDAWGLFGQTQPGWQRIQAVCDWLHSNITYGQGSNSNTSGFDAYLARRGVCRDFAHMGVMLCRALSIPARYVCGYLPDINVPVDPTPMDFHAWFEAYVGGEWHTFDARHNRSRTGRVLIGRGRDAVDVALATIYGNAELTSFKVWADEVVSQNSNIKTEEPL